ncbi:hypothetical protein A4G18_00380 [Pasteurellaceae bacterium Pebbles2]|nr:hypothetical protein [Pasteurellaceae bacterium Pebbles2]
MYYIEENVELHIDGRVETYGFFHIFKVAVDYHNNITEFIVSCWRNREHWLSFDRGDTTGTQENDRVLVFSIDKSPTFDLDPTNFCLRHLVTEPKSIFYQKKVRKDYDIISIETARLTYKEQNNESISIQQ